MSLNNNLCETLASAQVLSMLFLLEIFYIFFIFFGLLTTGTLFHNSHLNFLTEHHLSLFESSQGKVDDCLSKKATIRC